MDDGPFPVDGLTPSIETPEIGFFGRNELPPISITRVTKEQIQQFFDYLEPVPDVTKFLSSSTLLLKNSLMEKFIDISLYTLNIHN